FVNAVDEAFTNALLKGVIELPSQGAVIQVRILGGAMARVSTDATAFAHRDKAALVFIGAMSHEEEEGRRNYAWVLDRYEAVRRFGRGVYMAGLSSGAEEESRIGEAYPPATMERLRQVKRRYDPANFFHRNLNITPAEE